MAFESINRRQVLIFVLLLLVLPLLLLVVKTVQDFRRRAEYEEGYFRIEISVHNCYPESLAKGEKCYFSALVYDLNNQPYFNGFDYSWSISSDNSIGRLTSTEGPVTTFIAENIGEGDLVVVARPKVQSSSLKIEKGIKLRVTPGPFRVLIFEPEEREITCQVNDPNCYIMVVYHAFNRIDQPLYNTTIWADTTRTDEGEAEIGFIGFDGQWIWNEEKSTTERIVYPGEEAINTLVKMVPPAGKTGRFVGTVYIDGKTCNPAGDCVFYGATPTDFVINVVDSLSPTLTPSPTPTASPTPTPIPSPISTLTPRPTIPLGGCNDPCQTDDDCQEGFVCWREQRRSLTPFPSFPPKGEENCSADNQCFWCGNLCYSSVIHSREDVACPLLMPDPGKECRCVDGVCQVVEEGQVLGKRTSPGLDLGVCRRRECPQEADCQCGNDQGCQKDSDCDDNNPCTTDLCENNQCQHWNLADGVSCDQSDPSKICLAGQCIKPDCQPGERDCGGLGNRPRVCGPNYQWQLEPPCASGEVCQNGECIASDQSQCSSCPEGVPPKSQGNADCDGDLDLNDFLLWRLVYQDLLEGKPVSDEAKAAVDFNCQVSAQERRVDLQDFFVWRNWYRESLFK